MVGSASELPVIAGQQEDDRPGPGFAVYKWDGAGAPSEVRTFGDFRRDYEAFHPEVIVPLKKKVAGRLTFSAEVMVLSDDGNRPRAGGRTSTRQVRTGGRRTAAR